MRILPSTRDLNKEKHKNKFHFICLSEEEDKNNMLLSNCDIQYMYSGVFQIIDHFE